MRAASTAGVSGKERLATAANVTRLPPEATCWGRQVQRLQTLQPHPPPSTAPCCTAGPHPCPCPGVQYKGPVRPRAQHAGDVGAALELQAQSTPDAQSKTGVLRAPGFAHCPGTDPLGGGDWRRHCSNPAWSETLQFLSIFAPVYYAYGWKPSSHQPGWLEQM